MTKDKTKEIIQKIIKEHTIVDKEHGWGTTVDFKGIGIKIYDRFR